MFKLTISVYELMNKAVVFFMIMCAGVACNTSKYHGSDPGNNSIDSLPATIIEPAKKNRTILADTTSLYFQQSFDLLAEPGVLKVSERWNK
jgi:hypothetical protein